MLIAVSVAFASAAHGQQFPIPGKPIRIVVPFAPGGQTDVQARAIAQKLTISLGVPVFVENKPGAATLIGAREVQRAQPDGHTLLYTIVTHVQLPHLYKTPPYDPFKDFTAITTGSKAANVLTSHVSTPFNTVQELVAYAKANPGKLNYASYGVGTGSHLNGELFKRLAGIEMVHVPYKGSAEAAKDLLAGNVQLFFDGPLTAMANVQSGRVKLLAWGGDTRAVALPNLPTMREAGYEVGTWGYLWFWGPAGMAPTTVQKLYEHLASAITDPSLHEIMNGPGSEVSALPPAEMMREAKRLFDYQAMVVRKTGVQLD
jgi:tripartite-type tricarboxylate transporter receptor subunit TctC